MTRARDLADSADRDISGTLVLDDITLSNDISIADNGKAIFGAGSDLQIYHEGNHSFIKDTGTGDLKIQATNFWLQNAAGSKNSIRAVDGAEVNLYYNSALKLATTSTGIDVTGIAVTDGLTVAGNVSVDGGTIKLDGNYPVGTDNVALGNTAFDAVTSGIQNTAIGANSMTANTSGTNNTAVGRSTLGSNISGSELTAVGTNVLFNNTGSYNTAFGSSALFSNTTASIIILQGSLTFCWVIKQDTEVQVQVLLVMLVYL
jgi:hypothetical protein